ncbi:MAG: toll/interleukin-1 receptor domain-containing protein, partial [Caenispirillum sp.]|nr:toll/interleukin-1 receptor domain-containing protein [Caenispirillum sp.]
YVVWHPEDADGAEMAETIIAHFHGDAFSGLIGGAIEVYVRSAPWREPGGPPRPIPLPGDVAPPEPAGFVAIVPLLGAAMSRAAAEAGSPWSTYLTSLAARAANDREHIQIFPAALDGDGFSGALSRMFGERQALAAENAVAEEPEGRTSMLLRDLTQGLTQFMKGDITDPIRVFISHTKRWSEEAERETRALINTVRQVICDTRLRFFFDAHSLQSGTDWARELDRSASTCALLAVRTDLYASRAWCQREVVLAKEHGLPVVTLQALETGEARGSFTLDHVPAVPARRRGKAWDRASILRALGVLVDESLKRELWRWQAAMAMACGVGPAVDWWAPHAPEPLTLARWLTEDREGQKAQRDGTAPLILHPDPLLTDTERAALERMANLSGLPGIDPLTPRTLAARGGV